jgi:hypothetical protein
VVTTLWRAFDREGEAAPRDSEDLDNCIENLIGAKCDDEIDVAARAGCVAKPKLECEASLYDESGDNRAAGGYMEDLD